MFPAAFNDFDGILFFNDGKGRTAQMIPNGLKPIA